MEEKARYVKRAETAQNLIMAGYSRTQIKILYDLIMAGYDAKRIQAMFPPDASLEEIQNFIKIL